MPSLFKKMTDSIREDLGAPVSLLRFLAEHPEIRVPLEDAPRCIDADSIVCWNDLGESQYDHYPSHRRGTLHGWKMRGKCEYGSFILHRPEYEQLGQREIMENWTCDITDIHGFSASKSELRDFVSTDEMVETNSFDMIDAISHDKLSENLAHREIRIIHSPGSDHFGRYSWDGRLFLFNSGGSHHFAAAKYIAARLPAPVPLRGELYTYSLNAVAITSLRRDFEMFVISDETYISRGFYDAMEAFRATWLWHHLPRPFENAKAVLLPKNEARSMRVADSLRQAGVADLGLHLSELATQQSHR